MADWLKRVIVIVERQYKAMPKWKRDSYDKMFNESTLRDCSRGDD
jgi:hypothetical protein